MKEWERELRHSPGNYLESNHIWIALLIQLGRFVSLGLWRGFALWRLQRLGQFAVDAAAAAAGDQWS